jgi:hypothetical protein
MLDGPAAAEASPAGSPGEQVKRLQQVLKRTQERAAEAGKLYRDGILARVEMEDRQMRVVKASKELADALVAMDATQVETMKQGLAAKTATQADLDAANAELKKAQDRATAAAADWRKAQMDAAELDLKRKQQLYREGVGSRREVEQAEDRVALLTGSGAQ